MKCLKKAIAVMLAIVLALALFAGCGKSSPVGKYYIKSINGVNISEYLSAMIEESGISLEDFLTVCGIKSLDEYMTLEVKDDGSLVTTDAGAGGTDLPVGSWKQEDGKIIIDFGDGIAQEATLNGKELTLKDNGIETVLVRK